MTRVVILAGGKGERLRPLTEDRPKCMVSVMGRPILSYALQWLSLYGLTDITISCGYLHEPIRDYFGDGRKFGVRINYVVEAEPLGRGGALKKSIQSFGEPKEPVIALNGDLLTNLNLSDLLSFHNMQGGYATIVTVPLMSSYGIVDISQDGRVQGFREKPELPFWINAGIYVLSPQLTPLLPERGDHEVETFPLLAQEGKLKAFKTQSFWRTIDTVKDVSELRADLEQLFMGAFFTPSMTGASSFAP